MGFHIRAGTIDELKQDSGDWLFVDLGFSKQEKSCGVLKNDKMPCSKTFADLVRYVIGEVQIPGPPLNLLIEAPLSVSFAKSGNPTGRCIEKKGGHYRYWYINAGASTVLATGHLLRRVIDSGILREVRLFEGFASFKRPDVKTSHAEDVLRLRCSAWKPKKDLVLSAGQLKAQDSDSLEFALAFAGMNFGVPPVVKACEPKQDGHYLHEV